ncbi:uncharacterized protein N0V89_010790 [Didymosphaeria variabile]|uniref:Mmc1 C-terminal domain-containing protein n=1 Tax=Didymosphaeria variabile TaxID=1932322 RepID=A0A9W8XCG7_9PLEO|nr:uncharacterized protein N0V89_010790 [Didymosphaeria variabile]KAJ4346858.1 hypothetical protein N0V89_010790 [Didymosphaeria variabile]
MSRSDASMGGLRAANSSTSSALSLRTRSASTHVSPTAINYRPNVPPRNEELYNALSGLSNAAEQYVNLSRLQLALRGLAVENAVTRVAVLGLNSQVGAQRLARLLVVDPLAEKAEWEKRLEKSPEEGAVLLRFGDENDAHAPSPLYKILSVPSRVLETHNLEILVSTLNINAPSSASAQTTERSKDAVLVPKLQATSARGTPVPYPVHKTLVLGEDLDSALAFGQFTSDNAEKTENMVKLAIELPAPSNASDGADISKSTVAINSAVGAQGLDAIRISVANAVTYERSWFASGVPTVSKWITSELGSEPSIKPIQTALISSLLDDAEATITKEDAQQLQVLISTTTPEQLGAEMIGYLEQWAEKSHRELRDDLDEAFAAKNWRKLAWWKLFWRVDDVGMITEEVIARRWLVSAEKDAVYLAGRMKQAGFPDEVRSSPGYGEADAYFKTPADALGHEVSIAENQETALSTAVNPPTPWPALLSSARTTLLATTLPPLQALAQRLILTTLSTTSLSAALSVLLYASVSTVSLFEASAVAALGLTFSLRRMQKVWENGREAWKVEVKEEGRQALKRTEGLVRSIINAGGPGAAVENEGLEERKRAREAVAKVREALRKLSKE